MRFTKDLLQKAYKKLKCSVYYDKTQVLTRGKLVEFESEDVESILEELWQAFGDQEAWQKLEEEILGTIQYWVFPKKLYEKNISMSDRDKNDGGNTKSAILITNMVPKETFIESVQYFIDMDIRGHILGVLWLLLVGWRLDKMEYQRSYGNRMNRHLCKELEKQTISASPYLFEPYFAQYESWRDEGLNLAKSKINSNQDVVALTMDFKSFFYSLDMNESVQKEMFRMLEDSWKEDGEKEEALREGDPDRIILQKNAVKLSDFVFHVIEKYSSLFGQKFAGRRILPIGFLPSNVLANWSLYKFDKAMVDGWNPLYYGRYVDDIIIVDKVEKNSDLYTKAREEMLDSNEILKFYFTQCTRWTGMGGTEGCGFGYALFTGGEQQNSKSAEEPEDNTDKEAKAKNSNNMYYVNNQYYITQESKCHIGLQNEKVKIFYFKNGETDALLTCFRNQIVKNASEFRFLPEDDAAFDRDDYTNIYNLSMEESPNKLRGIEEISVDKYELSKFLGKFQRICGLVDDHRESRFVADILKIFDIWTLISNYTVWEKILTILAGNGEWKMLEQVIEQMSKAIQTVRVYVKKESKKSEGHGRIDIIEANEKAHDEELAEKVQECLQHYLMETWIRSLTLSWGPEVCSHIGKIEAKAFKYKLPFMGYEWVKEKRKKYLSTRMYDKYAVPVLLDVLNEEWLKGLNDEQPVSLRKLDVIMRELHKYANHEEINNWYFYYPFMVTQYDIYTMNILLQLKRKSGKEEGRKAEDYRKLCLPVECLEDTERMYIQINYVIGNREIQAEKLYIKDYHSNKLDANIICVGNLRASDTSEGEGNYERKSAFRKDEAKELFRIAVANTQLNHKNFDLLMRGKPNRSYARYADTVQIINHAIREKAALLVLPELFLPLEWLAVVARTCAKNQMALVTGIEYIVYEDKQEGKRWMYNYTAVILPYLDHDIPSAALSMHLKNHYAPVEQEKIRGYRGEEPAGRGYELYEWKGVWFPVYCCYELASIQDRAKFLSYADLIVAVEWNKDVNYYSSIIESLTRDAHCYCVQVNTADYGDSRLMYPGRTESKDIIRTKGGCNATVLVDTIDIKGLREFQLQEYNLQQKDSERFKPTPPVFDREAVLAIIIKNY